jgi:methionyl-tRNA formyltransferase
MPTGVLTRRRDAFTSTADLFCGGTMKIALIGSRWFGQQVFQQLLARGHDIVVVGTDAEDRLSIAAQAAGVPLTLLNARRRVRPEDLPAEEVDLIVAAHSHAFIPQDVCRRAKIAAIGYHPSLLPRHRGIAAVEWTIRCGDPVAGGSVYHLTDEMDAGDVAAQEEVAVEPGEDAASLWRRALAPMGIRLLVDVVDRAAATGTVDAVEQDHAQATLAPAIKSDAA